MYADLAALFEQIPSPEPTLADGTHFCALPVPDLKRHRLAKDTQGSPAVLISVATASDDRRLAPIVLENLSVHHDVDCRVTRPDGVTEEGGFTVVRCTGDRTLQSHFLRVVATMLQTLGDSPSRLGVAQAVSRLAELFHAMKQPPRKSLQGLWAELLLIARAYDPVALAGAWHVSPEALFDFSRGNQRIEVKSARGRARRHHFTLEQLQPPAGTQVIIASILVEPSEAGVSLSEILEQIRHRLGDRADLIFRVESVAGLTLGESWRHVATERFDLDLAEKSLAFYDPQNIPKVNPDVPSGVSDVRFKSDLSGQQPVEAARMRGDKGIFRAALRQ